MKLKESSSCAPDCGVSFSFDEHVLKQIVRCVKMEKLDSAIVNFHCKLQFLNASLRKISMLLLLKMYVIIQDVPVLWFDGVNKTLSVYIFRIE